MRARLLCVLLALALPAWAQDKAPAPKKAAKAGQGERKAHAKPTPEQIREFNRLQQKSGQQ